jgi:hypothetical protein
MKGTHIIMLPIKQWAEALLETTLDHVSTDPLGVEKYLCANTGTTWYGYIHNKGTKHSCRQLTQTREDIVITQEKQGQKIILDDSVAQQVQHVSK